MKQFAILFNGGVIATDREPLEKLIPFVSYGVNLHKEAGRPESGDLA